MSEEVVEITDASLVARARRGQPAAFEALVRRHYRASYAVALAILENGMDVEDVCQDAFVQMREFSADSKHSGVPLQAACCTIVSAAHALRPHRSPLPVPRSLHGLLSQPNNLEGLRTP